jgi:predicted RNA-binding Zn ribbon-like protein
MVFAPDTELALRFVVNLINSAANGEENLPTVEALDEFLRQEGFTGSRAHDAAELAAVRALRAPLRTLLTADRDTAVELVNEILTRYRAVPQLVRHDAFDYHLHAIDRSAPLTDRIAVETAMAMIDVIRSDDLSRLSVCADDTCDGLVVDLSRNRSRRYCSAACGNRIAVAAYRARVRAPE